MPAYFMDKQITVDNHSFNATYYAEKTEAEFIEQQINSVPDFYDDKKAFLKEAWKKVNPTEKPITKGK